jgi:hypothetical protein
MTSQQYEELCRLFLAELFRLGLDRIHSLEYPNPQRAFRPAYYHQIDLYWEIETPAAHYLHIANAKWHSSPHIVHQADVLLLQQVKIKLAAHKAFLITNTGFSDQGQAVAADEGIALHIVQPTFNPRVLSATSRPKMRNQLVSLAEAQAGVPLYLHQAIYKSASGVALDGASARDVARTFVPVDGGVGHGSHGHEGPHHPPSPPANRTPIYKNGPGPGFRYK